MGAKWKRNEKCGDGLRRTKSAQLRLELVRVETISGVDNFAPKDVGKAARRAQRQQQHVKSYVDPLAFLSQLTMLQCELAHTSRKRTQGGHNLRFCCRALSCHRFDMRRQWRQPAL